MPLKGRRPKQTKQNSGGIAVTDVFLQNKETKVPIVVNRGGARSSKSYSIIQILTERFFSLPGRQTLILRKTLPSLRKSTYRDFTGYLDTLGLYDRVKESKMEMCFSYGRSLIQFGCLDEPSKIKCFHPDTEILSDAGWKNIKEIVVGENVASLDPETFEMKYKPVSTVFEYDYDGKMVTLHPEDRKKTQIDFCVTPNHKMFTKSRMDMKYHFVDADKLPKNYYCLRSAKYKDGNSVKYLLDYSEDTYFGRVNYSQKENGSCFIDYKGKVNCIEVPPYHLVLSRLNGKPIWIGQSTQWNDIFMEEGTEFTYEDFIILRTRMSAPPHKPAHGKGWIPNQIFIAFNPEDENHWLKEKLIEKQDSSELKEIVSNYKDNPFLSADYIKILTDLEKDNPNYFRIYGLGEWGKLDHVIYSNWDVIDRFPLNCEEIIYGLDFGFNNPSALIKVGIRDGELFEEEMIYQSGLTNSDLIVALNDVIPNEHKRNSFLFCDSAEPDRISEISDAGFNVVPADKSIKDGIDMVKRFKTHIVRGSDNLLKEKRSYSWKMDRKTEKILDEPVKFNNHAVDAERYAIHTFFKEYGIGPMVRFL